MKVTGALRSSSGAEVPASLIVRGGNWRRRGRTLLGRFAAKGGKEMVVVGGERELKRSFVLFCFNNGRQSGAFLCQQGII